MTFRLFAGVVFVLVLSSAPVVLAVGEPSLVVADLPGYVHAPSAIDGEINGATLIQETGRSTEATTLDELRGHTGQGRSWRSSDGGTVAVAWVLDYDTETAASNLATAMTISAWQNGTPFHSELSGTGGVSISRDGGYVYSVFWRQGTHFAATTVSGPDPTKVANDVTLLARLEADTLQQAIGGERTTLGLPNSDKLTTPTTPGRTDLTRWVVAIAAATILATAALTVVVRRGILRSSLLAVLPPLPPGVLSTGDQHAEPAGELEREASDTAAPDPLHR